MDVFEFLTEIFTDRPKLNFKEFRTVLDENAVIRSLLRSIGGF